MWTVTSRRRSGRIVGVSIDFFDLLDDEHWVPSFVDPSDPRHHWFDGSPLADAPVDVARTFDGAMWRSSKIDPAFHLEGVRIRAGFSVPRKHLDQRQLVIVLDGELLVRCQGERDPGRTVGANQFFVISAGTPFSTTAGASGATYLETCAQPFHPVETYWHASGWIEKEPTS
jgi:mannose-6-phosphate isomerase-like protein (cupin superfamily)